MAVACEVQGAAEQRKRDALHREVVEAVALVQSDSPLVALEGCAKLSHVTFNNRELRFASEFSETARPKVVRLLYVTAVCVCVCVDEVIQRWAKKWQVKQERSRPS